MPKIFDFESIQSQLLSTWDKIDADVKSHIYLFITLIIISGISFPQIHMPTIDIEKIMETSQYKLAKDTNMPATRISEILKGRRRITADTALRLSAYFRNSADFWLGIQDEYDLRKERKRIENELRKISQGIAS